METKKSKDFVVSVADDSCVDNAAVNQHQEQQEPEQLQQQREGHLPLDLELKVLSWLPAKSVLRFRSVCKSWYCETQQHHFTHEHAANSIQLQARRNTTTFIFTAGTNGEKDSSSSSSSFIAITTNQTHTQMSKDSFFPHKEQISRLHVTCSCNGILCLSDPFATFISLYNPLTHQHLQLPVLGERAGDVGSQQISLVSGLSFDWQKKEYKVVVFTNCRLRLADRRVEWGVAVCTVPVDGEPRPWRWVEGTRHYNLCLHAGVILNGRLHRCFVESVEHQGERGWQALKMVSFDLRDERLREVPVEKMELRCRQAGLVSPVVAELHGHLALMEKFDHDREVIRVWTMEEYGNGESWTLKFSFTYPFGGMQLGQRPPCFWMPLLCLWKDEKLLVRCKSNVFSYDPKTNEGSVLYVDNSAVEPRSTRRRMMVPFISSLVSLIRGA